MGLGLLKGCLLETEKQWYNIMNHAVYKTLKMPMGLKRKAKDEKL